MCETALCACALWPSCTKPEWISKPARHKYFIFYIKYEVYIKRHLNSASNLCRSRDKFCRVRLSSLRCVPTYGLWFPLPNLEHILVLPISFSLLAVCACLRPVPPAEKPLNTYFVNNHIRTFFRHQKSVYNSLRAAWRTGHTDSCTDIRTHILYFHFRQYIS